MTYRSILVHLDESPRCAARVEIALQLARAHGAHLLGLAPTGLVRLPARVTPSFNGVPNYLELAQANLDEHATALVALFKQRVQAAGIESFEGRMHQEDSVRSLVDNARVHDLIVLGQTEPRSSGAALEIDITEQVFIEAGAPVLVVPAAGSFDEVGGCAVIAWNGSREAARAVRLAMPLLRKARSVHLLCLERPSDLRHLSRLQLNDARQWLARHGVPVQLHQEPVRMDVGEALLSRACDLAADLIVMGGYGHSRMAEFLLGGVTRRLLAHMTVPVLISH